jgi:hypothetical protein
LAKANQNGRDALAETITALESLGQQVPEPGSGEDCCSKFFKRVPKSIHERLAARIKTDYKKGRGNESFY